ncbi:uncharacterized protein LOC129913700 [Episyrphus balteatus]|uniref:uncharacterized protein LOC129913700 n=1 Tax=Episyrphus balteatus TaxID=286459 RepID=UPI002485441D|nr:uncharacterized protein LOC129913700 [Episyrphus balteatus]
MNNSKCQSTGYTPAYLTFGRECRTIDDVTNNIRTIQDTENYIPQIAAKLSELSTVLQNAKEQTESTQDRNKAYVDTKRRPQVEIREGDEVLVTTHILSQAAKNITAKFVPKRDGPYVVVGKVGSSSFQIANKDDLMLPVGTYHVSALTKINQEKTTTAEPIHRLRKRGRPKKRY